MTLLQLLALLALVLLAALVLSRFLYWREVRDLDRRCRETRRKRPA